MKGRIKFIWKKNQAKPLKLIFNICLHLSWCVYMFQYIYILI